MIIKAKVSCYNDGMVCCLLLYIQRVIEVCKEHLPSQSAGLIDSKVKFHIGDPMEYVQQHENYFDVILTDKSDPTTPGNFY